MPRSPLFSLLVLVATATFTGSAGASSMAEMKPQLLEEIAALEKAVQEENIPLALESNDLVGAWLREVQASDVSAVFLDVPEWSKEVGNAQSAGQAFLGGGISASCTYTHEKSGEVVEVQILANSPMFGMVSGMMGMAAATGQKVKRVAGHKAILDDSNGAQLQIPFGTNTLVSVDGSDTESAIHIAENGVGWERLEQALQ